MLHLLQYKSSFRGTWSQFSPGKQTWTEDETCGRQFRRIQVNALQIQPHRFKKGMFGMLFKLVLLTLPQMLRISFFVVVSGLSIILASPVMSRQTLRLPINLLNICRDITERPENPFERWCSEGNGNGVTITAIQLTPRVRNHCCHR